MNSILKKDQANVLSVLSQLMMILTVIQILVLFTAKEHETGLLWVAGSGFVGFLMSLHVFQNIRNEAGYNRITGVFLGLLTIVAYAFAFFNYEDFRLMLGFLMALFIVIFLVRG